MEDLSFSHTFETGAASLAYIHSGNRSFEKGLTLPLLQAELMFRLTGDFTVQCSDSPLINPEVVFFGLFTRPMEAAVAGDFSMAGIFLKPWGYFQLTGQSISPLCNQAIPATEIWGKEILLVRNQLLLATTVGDKMTLLKNFITKKPLHRLHPRVLAALDWLALAEGGQDLVYRLAKSLKVTEKTIHADFKREIGLSPVVYRLLLQFQESLRLLQDPAHSLSELAHELDYYDQAHFIKRFSAYAHMTPGHYRKAAGQATGESTPHYILLR